MAPRPLMLEGWREGGDLGSTWRGGMKFTGDDSSRRGRGHDWSYDCVSSESD